MMRFYLASLVLSTTIPTSFGYPGGWWGNDDWEATPKPTKKPSSWGSSTWWGSGSNAGPTDWVWNGWSKGNGDGWNVDHPTPYPTSPPVTPSPTACQTTVITFEDVCNPELGFGLKCPAGERIAIPNGYYGLNWENMCVLNITGTPVAKAATSGEFVATACNSSYVDVFGFPMLGGVFPRLQSVSLRKFQVSAQCPPKDPNQSIEDYKCYAGHAAKIWAYSSDLSAEFPKEFYAKDLQNPDFGLSIVEPGAFGGPIEVDFQALLDEGIDSTFSFRFQGPQVDFVNKTVDLYYDNFVVAFGCNSSPVKDNGSIVNNLKCTSDSLVTCETDSDCIGVLGCKTCAAIPSIHGEFLASFGNKFCVGE
jgi:hypothetical protein